MAKIHPKAIVEDGAVLAEDVEIGPYAFIGPDVRLGPGCVVHHHATVEGFTEMGENNEVFPYALIGGKTHDLKFSGGTPGLKIGNGNVFREYSTVHLATDDGAFTTLGNRNTILAYSHVAHDCQLGDHIVMSSNAALAGHVVCGDHVNIAWGSGVHQFCRLGKFCMVGGMAKLVQDVPPFLIADGIPAEARTTNRIGMERAGFTPEQVALVHQAFKTLFRKGLNRSQALEKLEQRSDASDPILAEIIRFVKESKRGIC
ncbi:MAG: acyl-ACP--UDP-N-acetylglucosamine O-acyltransferase [Verrucomicrobiota bacterium]